MANPSIKYRRSSAYKHKDHANEGNNIPLRESSVEYPLDYINKLKKEIVEWNTICTMKDDEKFAYNESKELMLKMALDERILSESQIHFFSSLPDYNVYLNKANNFIQRMSIAAEKFELAKQIEEVKYKTLETDIISVNDKIKQCI